MRHQQTPTFYLSNTNSQNQITNHSFKKHHQHQKLHNIFQGTPTHVNFLYQTPTNNTKNYTTKMHIKHQHNKQYTLCFCNRQNTTKITLQHSLSDTNQQHQNTHQQNETPALSIKQQHFNIPHNISHQTLKTRTCPLVLILSFCLIDWDCVSITCHVRSDRAE